LFQSNTDKFDVSYDRATGARPLSVVRKAQSALPIGRRLPVRSGGLRGPELRSPAPIVNDRLEIAAVRDGDVVGRRDRRDRIEDRERVNLAVTADRLLGFASLVSRRAGADETISFLTADTSHLSSTARGNPSMRQRVGMSWRLIWRLVLQFWWA
jgi:hypothetical protein